MRMRKLFSKKKRKPSQIVLINIIIGNTFSILMGILVWQMGIEIGGDSYLIVLLTLGIGMGVVLIPFTIVYFILRKKEKLQETDSNLDSESVIEKEKVMDQAITALSKSLGVPSSPEIEPTDRVCEYCGH
ncbi:MAG: hypothetical protein ACTSO3_07935 [Candidatus Heimdallarchaeaceae archaeon]